MDPPELATDDVAMHSGAAVLRHGPMPHVGAHAMGDDLFMPRFPDEEQVQHAAERFPARA